MSLSFLNHSNSRLTIVIILHLLHPQFDFAGLAAATQPQATDASYKYQSDFLMSPYHGAKLSSFMSPHHSMTSSSGEFGRRALVTTHKDTTRTDTFIHSLSIPSSVGKHHR
jgi:friend leukemia integration 1 transcription factor